MVLLIVLVVCVVILSPDVFGLFVAIHVYVEATLLVNGIITVPPLQIVAVFALVIAGIGLTVTVAVIAVPLQPLAEGVIVYTAVPATVLVAFKVCEMVAPEPAEAPLTFV